MRGILFLLALLISGPAIASEMTCPTSMTTENARDGIVARNSNQEFQVSIGKWQTILSQEVKYKPGNEFLNSSLIEGPPKEMGTLVPDNEYDEGTSYYWTLGGEMPYYIECEYKNTPYALYYRVPGQPKKCEQSAVKLGESATNKFSCQ